MKKALTVIILLFCVLTIVVAFASTDMVDKSNKFYKSEAEAIEQYISVMANFGDDEKYSLEQQIAYDIFTSIDIGIIENAEETDSYMVIGEAEEKGLINGSTKFTNGRDDIAKALKQQKAKICELFGEKAWENVTYILEDIDSPDQNEKCFNTKTGKEISEEECVEQGKQYWNSICYSIGIDFEAFYDFLMGKPYNEDEYEKYMDVFIKYNPDSPVKREYVSAYPTKCVNLYFNSHSKVGIYSDFRIVIANKGSGWEIIDGMRYTGELEEPID